MHRELHTWDRECRRDGASEWPSTGFSTVIGELDGKAPARRHLRRRRSGYLSIAIPFLIALMLGAAAMVGFARYVQG